SCIWQGKASPDPNPPPAGRTWSLPTSVRVWKLRDFRRLSVLGTRRNVASMCAQRAPVAARLHSLGLPTTPPEPGKSRLSPRGTFCLASHLIPGLAASDWCKLVFRAVFEGHRLILRHWHG